LIDAKFYADLVNFSEVTSRKTKWHRFFWPTLYIVIFIRIFYRIESAAF